MFDCSKWHCAVGRMYPALQCFILQDFTAQSDILMIYILGNCKSRDVSCL